MMSDIYLEKQLLCLPPYGLQFYVFIILLTFQSTTDAVTLIGSAGYAIPGNDFTLICNVPEEASSVEFYRRPYGSNIGQIQVAGYQCYNTIFNPPVVCVPGICSCVPTSTGGRGTVFRWIIQPQSGDHGSVWFCRRTNLDLSSPSQDSLDFTLNVADAVTLIGSADYALPGSDFTLTCDVPEEAQTVTFYRRPVLSNEVGSIQVGGDRQCYNTITNPPDVCDPDVCSCVPTSNGGRGTVFRWVIQPQSGDQGSVWFCRRTNLDLPSPSQDSLDFTLNVADGPGISIRLTPPDTTYTRSEGDMLPDITCTADCRPGCTFVWTKPDHSNFTVSAVLSMGQLDRSEQGTYRCTAGNVVGESTTEINVIVTYGPGTSIRLSPPDTTYTRPERDTLPDIACTADCRPGCIFFWTKPDNTNFTASPVLSLGQLDRSEHGTYRCTARNVVGESTKAMSVTVQYGPGTSTLSPPDTTYTRTEGDRLPDIICTADCRPGCTFVWTKPDNTNFTASAVLSLGQLDRSEHGTYRCTARNAIGESTTTPSVTISLKYGPGASTAMSPSDTSYTRKEGDTLPDITCVADCRPGCTFVWTKPDNTNFTVSPVLSLGQLDRSEHGTYRCTARNGIGESTITASVTVQYAGRPQQPLKLVISQLTSRSVVLSWEPGNEQETFETFRLTYQKHDDLSTTYVILNKTTTAFLIERLLPSTQYDVSVFAVNAERRSEALTGAFVTRESQIIGDESENTGDTGVVLISVGSVMILLGLLVFAVAIFMIRKGRLPYGRQNTTDKRSSTNKPHSSKDIGGVGQGERYEDLNLEQIEPPSEYDEVSNNQPDNGNTTTGNTRNVYEHLQRQSTANTYEDIPPKPGSGSDGMYANAAPN